MAFATGTSAERQVSPMMICPVLDEKATAYKKDCLQPIAQLLVLLLPLYTEDCFVQSMTHKPMLLDTWPLPQDESSPVPRIVPFSTLNTLTELLTTSTLICCMVR